MKDQTCIAHDPEVGKNGGCWDSWFAAQFSALTTYIYMDEALSRPQGILLRSSLR